MKIVNLWGGPNTGKSTAAAGLFYVMKINGFNVELIGEYAKDLTWDERHNVLTDQFYVLAKQNRKLERLRGKVDWVVTDSPLILGLNYTSLDRYYPHFESIAFDIWNSYDNLNLYLKSITPLPFQQVGRNQNQQESIRIDNKVKKFLDTKHIPYITINVVPNVVDPFVNHIKDILQLLN